MLRVASTRHSEVPLTHRFVSAVALCAVALWSGCGGGGSNTPSSPTPTPTTPPVTTPTPTPPPGQSIAAFITALMALDGTAGAQRSGAAPASAGGPSTSPSANNSVINGGSNQVRLRGSAPFQTVYASIGSVSGGVNGHWELRLPSATTDATVIVTLGRNMPASTFDMIFTAASAAGVAGPASTVPTRVVEAGTGDVQVSVSWNAASDVDLHVVEPGGTEIYYGNPTSPSGGELDLDSNAACAIDNVNNENIRWPVGRSPVGTYTVRLDYFAGCNVSSTNYVVTVNNGGSTQTFAGSFSGEGDFGGAGSGRLITTFSRAASSAAAVSAPVAPVRSPQDLLRMAHKLAMSAAHRR